jgi:hypothetical protein
MTDAEWWSHSHQAPTARNEPIAIGQPLSQLAKDGHTAAAFVRPIHGIGVELRYLWDGDLRVSQVFRGWDELEAAAAEKRRELEARGWQ